MSNKRVYLFRDGNATMRDLLGGKGANLAEMSNIGLPVPPGFTITTEVCNVAEGYRPVVYTNGWPASTSSPTFFLARQSSR